MNDDHMTALSDALRQMQQNADASDQHQYATLIAQVAIVHELRLLRQTLVAGLQAHGNHLGAWMQQIDSQLDALTGDHK